MGRDKWSSLFWVGVGVLICILSIRLSLGTLRSPGPGFLPFISGALLGGLALVVHLQVRRKNSSLQETKPIWRDPRRGLRMILTFIVLLAYAVGMEYLGFLISTFLFIAFLLKFIEPQRWTVVLFGSILASGVSYCIFELILQVQLPKGPFEIF